MEDEIVVQLTDLATDHIVDTEGQKIYIENCINGDTFIPATSPEYAKKKWFYFNTNSNRITHQWTGTAWKFIHDKISIKDFGVKSENTDNSTKINSFFSYGAIYNLDLFIDSGTYDFTSPLSIAMSSATGPLSSGGKRFSIKGAGMANTCFRYTGVAPINCLTVTGNSTGETLMQLEDFRVTVTQDNAAIRNSVGVSIGGGLTNFNFKNITTSFFDYGFKVLDAGEGAMNNLVGEHCNIGYYSSPSIAGIAPNAILFTNCAFNSNKQHGCWIENGQVNTFHACKFLQNGTNINSSALKIDYAGYNGGVGLTMIGNYIEGNIGHDVEVVASNGGAHTFIGNSFNRVNNDNNSAKGHSIYFRTLNLVAGDNLTKPTHITMIANSMWSTSYLFTGQDPRPNEIYLPSSDASRKRVRLFSPNLYNGFNVTDENHYSDAVEKPVYSLEWVRNKIYKTEKLDPNVVSTEAYEVFSLPDRNTAGAVVNNYPPISGSNNWIVQSWNWIQANTTSGRIYQEAKEIESGVSYKRWKFNNTWTVWAKEHSDEWFNVAPMLPNLGDIFYNDGTRWINLPKGASGTILTATSTSIAWQAGNSSIYTKELVNPNYVSTVPFEIFTLLPRTSTGAVAANYPPIAGYDNWVVENVNWVQNGVLSGFIQQEAKEIQSGAKYVRIKQDAANWTAWKKVVITDWFPVAEMAAVAGDIMYFDGTNWNRLPKGTNGQFLKMVSGSPAWSA